MSQALIACLTQTGTATVRIRLRLPSISAMTQRPSRCCRSEISKAASSRRRRAHPTSKAKIAYSLLPLRVDRSGTVSNSFACSLVSQFPSRLPRWGTLASTSPTVSIGGVAYRDSHRIQNHLFQRALSRGQFSGPCLAVIRDETCEQQIGHSASSQVYDIYRERSATDMRRYQP